MIRKILRKTISTNLLKSQLTIFGVIQKNSFHTSFTYLSKCDNCSCGKEFIENIKAEIDEVTNNLEKIGIEVKKGVIENELPKECTCSKRSDDHKYCDCNEI